MNEITGNILETIQKFGPLPEELILEMFQNEKKYYKKAIEQLIKSKDLYYVYNNYLARDIDDKPNFNLIKALWVLPFLHVDPIMTARDFFPCECYFIKNDMLWNVYYISPNNRMVLSKINNTAEERHIFVVDSEDIIDEYDVKVSNPVFAVIIFESNSKIPKIQFFA